MAKIARYVPVRAIKVTLWDRLVGALCYEPERGPRGGRPLALDMRKLSEEARDVLNEKLSGIAGDEAMREILRVGTSAGGGKSKAVIGWNRTTGEFIAGDRDLPEGFEHWIIKFTPREYPYRGQCEYDVYRWWLTLGVRGRSCADVGRASSASVLPRCWSCGSRRFSSFREPSPIPPTWCLPRPTRCSTGERLSV